MRRKRYRLSVVLAHLPSSRTQRCGAANAIMRDATPTAADAVKDARFRPSWSASVPATRLPRRPPGA